MYVNYEDAAEAIVQAANNVNPLEPYELALIVPHYKEGVAKCLRIDTGGAVHRTDFLTQERVERALKAPKGSALPATIATLFPKTWEFILEMEGE